VSASAPNTSAALALEVEALLEGRGLVRKAASGDLLTGLGARLTRASALPSRGAARETLPTGVDALDRILSGGLPRGGFVEVVARRSSGRFSLAIAALAAATSCGETASLVDVGGHFDPQSAEEAGVALERLLWVRPEKLKHAVAAGEMLLATGFALVVVDLGVPPVRGRFVPDAAWVRLERAARDRGAALLLLSPYRVGATAEAVVALDAARPVWRGERRAPPMLSGIGARMTLQKDAAAKEGARGELRLSADPVLEPLSSPTVSVRHPETRSAEGSPTRLPSTGVGAPRAAAPSRGDIGGAGASGASSSTVVGAGLAPAPSRRDIGAVSPLAASVRHPEARSAEGSPTRRAASGFDPGILLLRGAQGQDDAEPRNPSPAKTVLSHGDGMAPFRPPSPIPGEGGIFFPPAPAPYAAAPVQLSLIP
jgi:hypothetical protein